LIQLCVIPGNHKPFDLWSFLDPIMVELEQLATNGIIVNVGEEKIEAKVHLLVATGDLPAVADISNHRGHTSYYGCRICEVKGEYHGGMYFPAKCDDSIMRTVESYTHEDPFIRREFCLKAISPFTNLTTFTGPSFWGLDEMHLFGHGHGKLVYNMMNGDFDDQQSIFKLGNGVTMAKVGQAMVDSRSNIPSSFSGNWTDIKKHHSYFRAVDWLDFLLYVFPTLVIPNIINNEAREACKHLATGLLLASKWSIKKDDLTLISKSFDAWHHFLRNQINNQSLSPRIFTITQHYLKHVCYMITEMGPLPAVSCRSMERVIGIYAKETKSRCHPGKNLSNVV
ncbi:hypothetical protein BC941DRAFT_326308, partial [Chlamydoabsidia padenii]